MGIESLTLTSEGRQLIPRTDEEWRDWVSATATRDYTLNDPLLDWLDLYGKDHGFQRDDLLEGYDPNTDFSLFIMRKGTEFEAAVVKHLGTLLSVYTVATGPERSRDLGAAEETFEAMRRGEPVVSQAVLRDAECRTYGMADLLIRSDEVHRLFPNAITAEVARMPAADLDGEPWHYRVIDIKYSTLHFLAGGGLQDTYGSTWAYMVQVQIYNRALGRLQGYLPPEAYLLGRGWQQTIKGQTERANNCLERLGSVPGSYISRSKGPLAEAADAACAWIRRVRTDGQTWQVLPVPSMPELRPDMGSTSDQPWHDAKQRIGHQLEDLTLLWQVGPDKRRAANDAGVLRWTDLVCTPQDVGVTGEKRVSTLNAILDVNRSTGGPPVRPDKVRSAEEEWRPEPALEFYVDFETVSDLDDDFSRIPEKNGQPLIFMIGCGHVEDGEWRYTCFTADALAESHEAEIIDLWFDHMATVRRRLDPDGEVPKLLHWSHAEQTTFETAFNSAKERHPENAWSTPRWFDILKQVVREEPIVVRGAFSFGLKAVAKAMYAHGLIDTEWEAGPTDGMGAMVGAWSCIAETADRGCRLPETKLMQNIGRYNEVDCKVMMEIVRYLRRYH